MDTGHFPKKKKKDFLNSTDNWVCLWARARVPLLCYPTSSLWRYRFNFFLRKRVTDGDRGSPPATREWSLKTYRILSRQLSFTEKRYSTFGRVLFAIFSFTKHFKHYIEGRDFYIFTDHHALTKAILTSTDNYLPHESRQLEYIS